MQTQEHILEIICPKIYNLDFIKLQQNPQYCLDMKHGPCDKKKKEGKKRLEIQEMIFLRPLAGFSRNDHIGNDVARVNLGKSASWKILKNINYNGETIYSELITQDFPR